MTSHRLHAGDESFDEAKLGIGDLMDGGVDLGDGCTDFPPKKRGDELLLALETAVNRHPTEFGASRDVLHRGAPDADEAELFESRVENAFAHHIGRGAGVRSDSELRE